IAGTCFEALGGYCDDTGTCLPYACAGTALISFGFTHAELMIRDDAGQDADRLNWYLLSPHDRDHIPPEPPGDPTVDTTYAFCVYERAETPTGYDYIANVRYEKVFDAGESWKK